MRWLDLYLLIVWSLSCFDCFICPFTIIMKYDYTRNLQEITWVPLYPHKVVDVTLLVVIRFLIPTNTATLFFICWLIVMSSSKWPGRCLSFKFSDFIMSPRRIIPLKISTSTYKSLRFQWITGREDERAQSYPLGPRPKYSSYWEHSTIFWPWVLLSGGESHNPAPCCL